MTKPIQTIQILFLLFAVSLSSAQVVVRKGSSEKASVDLSGFTAGGDAAAQVFRKTVDSDLMRSGWFVRAMAGQGAYNVVGTIEGGGSLSVECRVFSRGTGQSKLSKSYNGDANGARRLAHKVSDDIVMAITGHKGIASGRLAVVGNRTGKKEIYLCDPDGQGMTQLTRDNSIGIGPNWGPGGQQLVYTSFMKGYPDVYLIELGSGNRKRIAGYSGLNTGAAISPDGQDVALVLSKDGNPELYVKNLASGALTRLTNTKRSAEASPSWSPDGHQIVYVSDQAGQPQLFIMDRSGGSVRRLTGRGSQNVAPDWGPSGLITYASLIGGKFQVCVADPATGDTKQITSEWVDWEDPTWAPDGRHIVCARTQAYHSKLYLLDMMGDPPLGFTDSQGDWYSPSWSR